MGGKMGECKSISINELMSGNKRMCLSVKRVFDKCDECEVMLRYYQDQTRTHPKGIKPCESAVFSKERLEYIKRKSFLRDEIKKLEVKIKDLKGGLKE